MARSADSQGTLVSEPWQHRNEHRLGISRDVAADVTCKKFVDLTR